MIDETFMVDGLDYFKISPLSNDISPVRNRISPVRNRISPFSNDI